MTGFTVRLTNENGCCLEFIATRIVSEISYEYYVSVNRIMFLIMFYFYVTMWFNQKPCTDFKNAVKLHGHCKLYVLLDTGIKKGMGYKNDQNKVIALSYGNVGWRFTPSLG